MALKESRIDGLMERLQTFSNEQYEKRLDSFLRFHALHPELKNRVTPESLVDLRSCGQEGSLFEVKVGDKSAGLIAAHSGQQAPLRGWCVWEEFLYEEFRGQGLATVMQRLLVHNLPPREGDSLFGTIDYRNLPSLKTALGVGRIIVGTRFFCPLFDTPAPVLVWGFSSIERL